MRTACLLLLALSLGAADWFEDARKAGAVCESENRWADAATVYEGALRRLGSGAPAHERFWLLTSLAEVSFERQDYPAARGWLRQAIPQDDAERIRLLNAQGTLELVEGNLTAAERNLKRAADLSASAGNPLDAAAALHNLAAVEMHTGRLRDAESHERQALNLWRRELGDRHHYVLKAWISLSSVQGLSGDWHAAEASLQEALTIAPTPEALANYAVVLDKLHRTKEAGKVRSQISLPAIPLQSLIDVHSTNPPIRTR